MFNKRKYFDYPECFSSFLFCTKPRLLIVLKTPISRSLYNVKLTAISSLDRALDKAKIRTPIQETGLFYHSGFPFTVITTPNL